MGGWGWGGKGGGKKKKNRFKSLVVWSIEWKNIRIIRISRIIFPQLPSPLQGDWSPDRPLKKTRLFRSFQVEPLGLSFLIFPLKIQIHQQDQLQPHLPHGDGDALTNLTNSSRIGMGLVAVSLPGMQQTWRTLRIKERNFYFCSDGRKPLTHFKWGSTSWVMWSCEESDWVEGSNDCPPKKWRPPKLTLTEFTSQLHHLACAWF